MHPKVIITSRCARTMLSQRLQLALAARDSGFMVVMAGEDTDQGKSAAALNAEGLAFRPVAVRQGSLSPLDLAGLILAYYKLLRRERADILHAFTIKPVIAGLIAAGIARTRTRIATIPGLGHSFLSHRPGVRLLVRWLYWAALSCAHRVYFYNRADRDLFVALGIVDPAKCAIVNGSGIDTERFLPMKVECSENPRFTVLYVGRLITEKGVRELIDAAAILARRSPHIRIQLLGDADSNNPTSMSSDELAAAQCEANIELLGTTDDVRPYLARADAIVLPSYREGIPLALLEGAAMGKPLIATDVPGCRDVVMHEVTGLLVPPYEGAALADAIELLATSPVRVIEMGIAARQDVITRFSSAAVSGQVVADYWAMLRVERT